MAYILTAITGSDTVGQAFTKVNGNLNKQIVSGYTQANNLKLVSKDGTEETISLSAITTSADFLPLSGGTLTGDLNITDSNKLRIDDGNSAVNSIEIKKTSIDFIDDFNGVKTTLQYSPIDFQDSTIDIIDTLSDGYMVIAPDPSGNDDKFVKVNSNGNGWDYVDGLSGDFVPLTGTSTTNPFDGELLGYSSASIRFEDDDTNQGIKITNSGITFQDLDDNVNANLKFTPLTFDGDVNVNISDGLSDGYMVIAPDPTGNENKFVKVNNSGTTWEYVDGTSGDFVPLTGLTSTNPITGDLYQKDNTFYWDNTDMDQGVAISYSSITFQDLDDGVNIKIKPSFVAFTDVNVFITDTKADGYVVIADNPSGQDGKSIRVASGGLAWEYYDGLNGDFENITYADAYDLALDQTGGNLKVGQWYRITAAELSRSQAADFNLYGDIILKAITPNKFSSDGYLLQINADYQGVGNYGDVPSYFQNYGVPYFGQTVGQDSSLDVYVVIWNNQHYALTDDWTLETEGDITGNFELLTKDYTTNNGYIVEPVRICYDVITNKISLIEDKRGNVLKTNDDVIYNYFRFGDDNVKCNNIASILEPIELLNYPNGNLIFKDNQINRGKIVDLGTTLIPSTTSIDFQANIVNDFNFVNDPNYDFIFSQSHFEYRRIIGFGILISVDSSIIDVGTTWGYYQQLNSTGGTFNGIVTAITQTNQITNYFQTFEFNNNLNQNITFRNSSSLKTEGGLDAVLKQGDSIEFYLQGGTAYQKNINNYI